MEKAISKCGSISSTNFSNSLETMNVDKINRAFKNSPALKQGVFSGINSFSKATPEVNTQEAKRIYESYVKTQAKK